MSRIQIPRSAVSRAEPTYAQLLRLVHPDRIPCRAFEGKLLKCGSTIDYSAFRSEGYPEKPLLIEFAGKEGPGRNRRDVHILWRYESDPGSWVEILRTLSRGADWVFDMQAAALRQLGGPPPANPVVARKAAAVLLSGLDFEFRDLSRIDRLTALTVVYEQIVARMVDAESANGPILGL